MLFISVWAVNLMKRILVLCGRVAYVLVLFMLGTMLVQPRDVSALSTEWKQFFEYLNTFVGGVCELIRSKLMNCPIFSSFIVL